jgi:hypothetical protein
VKHGAGSRCHNKEEEYAVTFSEIVMAEFDGSWLWKGSDMLAKADVSESWRQRSHQPAEAGK